MKTRSRNAIASWTLLASCVAAVSGVAALYYQSRQTTLAHAGIRPLITLPSTNITYSASTVTIDLELLNVGKTTASLAGVKCVVGSAGGLEYSYKFPDTDGTVLSPGERCHRKLKVSRTWEVNGAAHDLAKGVNNTGRLGILVNYSGIELDGETFASNYSAQIGNEKPNRDE